MHVLKDVGESVEEKAQEEIKNEKKKTGIQVCNSKIYFENKINI